MSWLSQTFSSTLGRKLVMSLSGLFLIFFLLGHLSGNFLLFANDGGKAFNEYAYFMNTNPAVQVVRYTLYVGFLVHIVWAVLLTIRNRQARPVGYAVNPQGNSGSTWISRNMGVLGTLLAIFLIIHLRSFYFELKFGNPPVVNIDGKEVKDLYAIVAAAFSQWWYSALYVVLMVSLAFHLAHGFQSAFRTLGANHKKYLPLIKKAGLAFSVLVPLAFASMPIYMYLKGNGII